MSGPTIDLTAEAGAIWNRNAAFWDAQMGEGNLFFHRLLAPSVERLLPVVRGTRVLDIGCGNGVFARWLTARGAEVVATDVSERFIDLARARSEPGVIDYRVVDAMRGDDVRALGDHSFDAVLCSMALMDIPDIEPLLESIPYLLAPGGAFVFAVQHPCFNSNAMAMLIEQEDREGTLATRYSLRLSDYLQVPPGRGIGIVGQPEPHFYFHRPLSELLGRCFHHGLVLDGLAEPALEGLGDETRGTNWVNYPRFPPVLVGRLRSR